MRRWSKRSQSGQSLIILAIGFIALVGFVGIVTDVSVLFIRYSTLRRAVDAAAVSAASQMRRLEDTTFTDTNSDGIDDIAEDEADSVTNLNLAARSFIELYGLDPRNVIVETCRAQQVGRDGDGNPLDSNGVKLFEDDGTVNPFANQRTVELYQQLCTEDELKLVRVTAQIEAPTMFLYLLGYPSVTLTESAMSQTAVLDVILIMDVSESMLNETTYTDWEEHDFGYRYLPPVLNVNGYAPDFDAYGNPVPPVDVDGFPIEPRTNSWDVALGLTQAEINDRIFDEEPNTAANTPVAYDTFLEMINSPFLKFDSPTNPGQREPREECQIRFWPRSQNNQPVVPAWLQAEYTAFLGSTAAFENHFRESPRFPDWSFTPFVPMYDFYDCCNNPGGVVDGDGNYSFDDLVCQPFREARDAAEGFLSRLDFKRGDRVAFVAFDRYATLIDPDGPSRTDGTNELGLQDPMIETERNLADPDTGQLLRYGAVETLRTVIGVRSEGGTYIDGNDDGRWDHMHDDVGVSDEPGAITTWATWYATGSDARGLHDEIPVGEIYDQPVPSACPFDMVTLFPQFSYADYNADGTPRALPPLNDVITIPAWFPITDPNVQRESSYENRASCRGTNIGSALGAAAQALYINGRREGAVWIMVLLSDGAAGASDPMSRVGGGSANIPIAPQPFNTIACPAGSQAVINGVLTCNNPIVAPAPAYGYAAFGVCPYGNADTNSAVDSDGDGNANNDGWGELLRDTVFPFCGDRYPQTRNFCATVPTWPSQQALDENNCINYYDVDDYARDWADWVGLADLVGAGTSGTGRVSEQLLPTIFTIGFGLNFDGVACDGITDDAQRYACMRGYVLPSNVSNILNYIPNNATSQTWASDYLGEELLRYIGDVGDNFRMDNDYWQTTLGNRIPNAVNPADLTDPDWGGRGPCEMPTGTRGTWAPLPPGESCGNYFSAATGSDQLVEVFNEIAARMFTRLSR